MNYTLFLYKQRFFLLSSALMLLNFCCLIHMNIIILGYVFMFRLLEYPVPDPWPYYMASGPIIRPPTSNPQLSNLSVYSSRHIKRGFDKSRQRFRGYLTKSKKFRTWLTE